MATNQGGRQAGARAIGGTTLDYNGDFLAMFAAHGFSTGAFNERFLRWLNYQLGASYTNLPGAMHAYAVACGFNNWDSLNTITDLQAGGGVHLSSLILEDGTSYLLQEDGSSSFLLE